MTAPFVSACPRARGRRPARWPRLLLSTWLAPCACTEPSFDHPQEAGVVSPSDSKPPSGDAATAVPTTSSERDAHIDASVTDGSKQGAVGDERPPDTLQSDAAEKAMPPLFAADATVQSPSELPSWAPELDGLYAGRVVNFAEETGTIASARILQLVEISHQGSEYQLTLKRCSWIAKSILGDLIVKEPSKLAPLRQRLSFDGESFSSSPIDYAHGYDALAPECANKPGQAVPKRDYQTWIAGTTCTCPGPAVPMTLDDCRITDPDGDERAGFTMFFDTGAPLVDADVWGVGTYYTSMVHGERRADGTLTAQLEANESSVQLGCSLESRTTCIDFTGTAPPCPPVHNRADLVPLEGLEAPSGGWSCEALLLRQSELFVRPEPVPPVGCGR